ncbi:MAG TPA: hypothetical protein VJA22_00685 [Patescibacteria group bacterium]|nr:hypothetical protein [Patescibacteria group bacterium]
MSPFTLNGKILTLNIDTSTAQIVMDNTGQILDWPLNQLPDNIAVGDIIFLHLETEESEKNKKEAITKNILNQLLRA